jgi:alanyl-tRNA synthetase
MDAQRERARTASQFGVDYNRAIDIDVDTVFTGYQNTEQKSKILGIFVDGSAVDIIGQDQRAVVVLDQTPFYAESGGQVGDTGKLITENAVFLVEDTQKQGKTFLHIGIIDSGSLRKGDSVHAEIDNDLREAIKRNHSATHLMHAALRDVLGDHVQQKGSLVTAERTRFDFSHFEPVTREQIYAIERQVNAQIMHNIETRDVEMPLVEAKKAGAMALFGEKYDDIVRVVSMGDYSTELCGGTHVERSGDIGFFKIVAESGVAAGVRRIEAVTGAGAVAWAERRESQLDAIADALKSSRDEVEDKVRQLVDRVREQEKAIVQLKGKMASQAGSDLSAQAEEINGVHVLTANLDGADSKALRDTLDQLKNKLGSAAIVLTSEDNGKVRVVAGVTKDQTALIKAGELVNVAAAEVGGKGGGRSDMAQAGGNQPENIDKALAAAKAWLKQKLT